RGHSKGLSLEHLRQREVPGSMLGLRGEVLLEQLPRLIEPVLRRQRDREVVAEARVSRREGQAFAIDLDRLLRLAGGVEAVSQRHVETCPVFTRCTADGRLQQRATLLKIASGGIRQRQFIKSGRVGRILRQSLAILRDGVVDLSLIEERDALPNEVRIRL